MECRWCARTKLHDNFLAHVSHADQERLFAKSARALLHFYVQFVNKCEQDSPAHAKELLCHPRSESLCAAHKPHARRAVCQVLLAESTPHAIAPSNVLQHFVIPIDTNQFILLNKFFLLKKNLKNYVYIYYLKQYLVNAIIKKRLKLLHTFKLFQMLLQVLQTVLNHCRLVFNPLAAFYLYIYLLLQILLLEAHLL